jgi:DNA-binding CsgD family transcriptional regulator
MRLSHGDFDALQRTILELYEYRDLETFRKAIPRFLFGIMHAEAAGLCSYDLNQSTGKVWMNDMVCSDDRFTPKTVRALEETVLNHPFADYFKNGGDFTALKDSDFMTRTQLRNSVFWDGYSMMKLDETISAPVLSQQGKASIMLGRWGRDFSERDRMMLNLLRPHFDQAHRNAHLVTTARRCGAKPLAAYGLLPRETEVARWLAMGKTNPEIGLILGISPRTVDKHAEHIFHKLGVENRTTAALMIAQAASADRAEVAVAAKVRKL